MTQHLAKVGGTEADPNLFL